MRTSVAQLVLGAVLVATPVVAVTAPADWTARMQSMAAVLAHLLPDLVSEERFASPERRASLLRDLHALRALGHDLKGTGTDPLLKMGTANLRRHLDDAEKALTHGNPGYARSVLLGVTQQCIACHTRADLGSHNPPLTLRPDVPGLAPIDRGMVLAATRNFDAALLAFSDVIADERTLAQRPALWRRAMVHALNIAVRAKDSPTATANIVALAARNSALTEAMRKDVIAWSDAAAAWGTERPPPKTERGLHTNAVALLDRHPTPSLVDALRAAALLHAQLQLAPAGPLAAAAMLRLGGIYEELPELDGAALAAMAYRACIDVNPRAPEATRCLQRYENAMKVAWSGRGGTTLPLEVEQELKALRAQVRR